MMPQNAVSADMKLATYEVNGIYGRLPVFPAAAIEEAGYGAIRQGHQQMVFRSATGENALRVRR